MIGGRLSHISNLQGLRHDPEASRPNRGPETGSHKNRRLQHWPRSPFLYDFLPFQSMKSILPNILAFVEIVVAVDQRAVIEKAMKDLAFLQDDMLGVLLYGSWATGESHECLCASVVSTSLAIVLQTANRRSLHRHSIPGKAGPWRQPAGGPARLLWAEAYE